MGRLLLKNGTVYRADGRLRPRVSVLIEGGRVTGVGPDEAFPALPGDWVVQCERRLVAPGLVDCHTHLVGAGLLPTSGELALRGARVRLEYERRLGEALTVGEVEALTAHALARALLRGVTLNVEHLFAPGVVEEGLSTQRRAAEALGGRMINSHATLATREHPGEAQLEANAAYARGARGGELVRPAVGFWSAARSDDELLRRLGRVRDELGLGAHFHLGETAEDEAANPAGSGRGVVARLDTFGLLGPGGACAFGLALGGADVERLVRSRTLLAMHHRGSLWSGARTQEVDWLSLQDALVGLGTCGEGTLFEELTASFHGIVQAARAGRLLDPDGCVANLVFGGPAELCSLSYGAPSGVVEEGALADLVVYDEIPPEEEAGGLSPHLPLTLSLAKVAWTIVAGRVVVREGRLVGHSELELAREAARAKRSVWARLSAAPPPPPPAESGASGASG